VLGDDVGGLAQLIGGLELTLAAMILARFSRSASACLAMARCIVSGSWMSLISTVRTATPQASVCVSMMSFTFWLIVTVSDRTSSSENWPTMLRTVVWAIWLTAETTLLNGHQRLGRIHDLVVGHCGDINRDVVLGDDLLRGHRHGDDLMETLRRLSITGMMMRSPGPFRRRLCQPEHHGLSYCCTIRSEAAKTTNTITTLS